METSSYIGPICDTVLETVILEVKKPETKEKIMSNIIDPLLADLMSRYYPYFIMIISILVIIIVLLFALLILNVINNTNKNILS